MVVLRTEVMEAAEDLLDSPGTQEKLPGVEAIIAGTQWTTWLRPWEDRSLPRSGVLMLTPDPRGAMYILGPSRMRPGCWRSLRMVDLSLQETSWTSSANIP